MKKCTSQQWIVEWFSLNLEIFIDTVTPIDELIHLRYMNWTFRNNQIIIKDINLSMFFVVWIHESMTHLIMVSYRIRCASRWNYYFEIRKFHRFATGQMINLKCIQNKQKQIKCLGLFADTHLTWRQQPTKPTFICSLTINFNQVGSLSLLSKKVFLSQSGKWFAQRTKIHGCCCCSTKVFWKEKLNELRGKNKRAKCFCSHAFFHFHWCKVYGFRP